MSATILILTGWLVFILLFAAFWARPPLDLFQEIVIFFVSLILAFGMIAAVWASWGMRFMDRGWERWR